MPFNSRNEGLNVMDDTPLTPALFDSRNEGLNAMDDTQPYPGFAHHVGGLIRIQVLRHGGHQHVRSPACGAYHLVRNSIEWRIIMVKMTKTNE